MSNIIKLLNKILFKIGGTYHIIYIIKIKIKPKYKKV